MTQRLHLTLERKLQVPTELPLQLLLLIEGADIVLALLDLHNMLHIGEDLLGRQGVVEISGGFEILEGLVVDFLDLPLLGLIEHRFTS